MIYIQTFQAYKRNLSQQLFQYFTHVVTKPKQKMSDSEEDASSGMEESSTRSNSPSILKPSQSNSITMDSEGATKLDKGDADASEPHPNSFIKLTNLRKDFGATPAKQHAPLVELTRPHRESFDWLISEGLFHIARDLPPVEFQLRNGCRISINFEEVEVRNPIVNVEEKVGGTKL